MGMFDTLWHTCPGCGCRDAIQIKPTAINGEMLNFDVETAPSSVKHSASYLGEFCSCGIKFDLTNQDTVVVSKEYMLDEILGKKIEFNLVDSNTPELHCKRASYEVDFKSPFAIYVRFEGDFELRFEGAYPQKLFDDLKGLADWTEAQLLVNGGYVIETYGSN